MTVITQHDEDRMRLNAVNCDSVDRLIAFINTCQVWCYHALLRAMALSNQGHLIPPGGLPVAVYMEGIPPAGSTDAGLPPKKQHFYKKVDSDVKIGISQDLLPGLLQHCEVSDHILMKAGLFGFHDDITIDITEFHICTDVNSEHNREKKTIKTEELFDRLFQRHAPNTLLVEGEAGSGKSTYMQDYAHKHSKEFIECEGKGPGSPCVGHNWKLILYIPAGLVIGSQEAAIREHIHCNDKYKDKIMSMIDNDGDGVLIMNDGLDEVRGESERKSFRRYIKSHQKSGSPKILNSSRTGLCQMEKKFFDRKVTHHGFTTKQGIAYFEKYFEERSESKADNPVLLSYIKQHATELEWVLTNPLCVHVFSELVVSGALTQDDIKTLNTAKLLKVLEAFVLAREEARSEADTAGIYSSEFYNLCLEHFLRDERMFAVQSIAHISPYRAFLNRHKAIDLYARESSFFMFEHTILYDFFSMQGLVQYLKSNPQNKKALLLSLCGDPSKGNALQLLCGFISEYTPELKQDLVFIIQACLILQVEEQQCEKNQLTQRLLQLPDVIKRNFTASAVYKGVSPEQAKMATDFCEEIQLAFTKNAESLRTAGWFSNLYNDIMTPTQHLKFITASLRQCRPSLQEEVCSQTTHRLLPCVRYGAEDGAMIQNDYVFAVSSVRWGVVKEVYNSDVSSKVRIFTHVWCPSAVVPTLTQFTTHRNPAHPTGLTFFTLHLSHAHAFLWGEPQPEEWLADKWVCALQEVLKYTPAAIIVMAYRQYSSTSLDALLEATAQVITHPHMLLGGLHVHYGHVNEKVLEVFSRWARLLNVRVQLGYSAVYLGTDSDEDYVTLLHHSLQDILSTVYPPTYYTPEGGIVDCNLNTIRLIEFLSRMEIRGTIQALVWWSKMRFVY